MRAAPPYAARPVAAIVEITAEDAHPVRRLVLRGGDPESNVALPEDVRPGAFHLGARRDGGTLIGVASFSPTPPALVPAPVLAAHGVPAAPWQLRGMAVVPACQESGTGRALLEAAFARLRAAGADLVWANARDVALPFYERLGMSAVGGGFMAGPRGDIPHHVVFSALGRGDGGSGPR